MMNDPASHRGDGLRYARSKDAVASSVGDRFVLYHRVSKSAIVLNPTGSWLWERLAEPRTVVQLTNDLLQRFPSLRQEDAERDVTHFLGELTHHAMAAAFE
jgi:hypothetical protein